MDQFDNRSYFGNGDVNVQNGAPQTEVNSNQNNNTNQNENPNSVNDNGFRQDYSSNGYGYNSNVNYNQNYNNQNNGQYDFRQNQFGGAQNPQRNNTYSYGQYGYNMNSVNHSNAYNSLPVKEKKGASKGFVIGMVAIGLVLSMLFGAFLSTVLYSAGSNGNNNTNTSVVVEHKTSSDDDSTVTDKGTAAYAASLVADSVVEINTETITYNSFYGQMISSGAGSGVIISSTDDGTYIITCAHVIEGAKSVTVILNDGTSYEAETTAYDSISDIGVIKINVKGLKTAPVSDTKLIVAQEVIAIGNPLGKLGGSVSKGIVSALEREIEIDGINYTLIQTDASINAGNSGGGLFDLNGNLVGIVNAKSTGTSVEGLGFAIPIDNAMSIFEDLVTNGYVSGRVQLGIKVIDIQSSSDIYEYPQYYKYFTDYGVYIVDADNEDFETGDRIVSVDKHEITCYNDLRNILLDYSVGDTVDVQVSRITSSKRGQQKTELITVQITLTEMKN